MPGAARGAAHPARGDAWLRAELVRASPDPSRAVDCLPECLDRVPGFAPDRDTTPVRRQPAAPTCLPRHPPSPGWGTGRSRPRHEADLLGGRLPRAYHDDARLRRGLAPGGSRFYWLVADTSVKPVAPRRVGYHIRSKRIGHNRRPPQVLRHVEAERASLESRPLRHDDEPGPPLPDVSSELLKESPLGARHLFHPAIGEAGSRAPQPRLEKGDVHHRPPVSAEGSSTELQKRGIHRINVRRDKQNLLTRS